MRLRNKKGAHDIIASNQYVLNNYKEYKGNFSSLFENNNDIEIEIGMGKGDFIIGKAINNPNINFIGIEKYATVLVSALKKLNGLELNNLKIINADAMFIDDIFDKEISKIYLNFSDPWPKKRHSHRRLTSKIFLSKYLNLFKDKKIIEMKTDNKSLFEYSIVSLNDCDFKIEEVNLDLYSNLPLDNVCTEYEKKFSSLGNTIYKLVAVHKVDNKKIK